MKINTMYRVIVLCVVVAAIAFTIGKSFPDKDTYLNMSNVCDFKAMETGLMLYTENGDGYYWER